MTYLFFHSSFYLTDKEPDDINVDFIGNNGAGNVIPGRPEHPAARNTHSHYNTSHRYISTKIH